MHATHGMNGVLYRFTFKENSYDEMDHPTGMRVGTDRMRHLWHWQVFRILVGHGLFLGFVNRHDVVAERLQFRQLRQLWLRLQRLVGDQPQRFFQLLQPELG